MLNCIIIDDENHCIDRLKKIIAARLAGSVTVRHTCQSVDEGIRSISSFSPDLVFLDVQLNDQTGFDLLSRLDDIPFEIIFTTAFDRYAVQAFKFSAIDYLLKPVDEDELVSACSRAQKRRQKAGSMEQVENLLQGLASLRQSFEKICIPDINGLQFVPVSDIIRCQSNVNYTTIYLKDQLKLTTAKTLKEFEELLGENNFFRIHNSHLINLSHMRKYNRGKGGTVTMADGTELEVSLRRKDEFLKRVLHKN